MNGTMSFPHEKYADSKACRIQQPKRAKGNQSASNLNPDWRKTVGQLAKKNSMRRQNQHEPYSRGGMIWVIFPSIKP